jgi:hypothetical protein
VLYLLSYGPGTRSSAAFHRSLLLRFRLTSPQSQAAAPASLAGSVKGYLLSGSRRRHADREHAAPWLPGSARCLSYPGVLVVQHEQVVAVGRDPARVAVAFVVVVLVVGGLIAYAIYQWGRQLALGRKTRAELTTSQEYRSLSEMAITAQEHTDMELAEIDMRLA